MMLLGDRVRFGLSMVVLAIAACGAVTSVRLDAQAHTDSIAVAAPDTGITARPDTAGAPAAGAERPAQAPYVMPPLIPGLLDHLHNKIVHFPIVLALVAAVLVLLSRRRPELEPIAFWMVWAASLATLAAYFSGVAQAEEFARRPKRWLADTHRNWGIALAVAQAVWIFSLLRRPTRTFARLWSVVVVALVLVAAFLGGLLAHGRGGRPAGAEQPRAEARP
jgi:uncharacterized membrane protein